MSRGDGGHLGQRGRAMTIHHEAQDFIVRPEPALVLLSTSTTETPRLVPLPPLGFPPTTTVTPPPELTTAVTTAMLTTARTLALPDLSSNVPLALEQLVAAALGSLPLWFLLGELRSYFLPLVGECYYCPHGRRAVGPGDQLLGVLAAVGALLPLLPLQAAVGQPRHHQGRGGPGSPRPGRRPRRGVPGD